MQEGTQALRFRIYLLLQFIPALLGVGPTVWTLPVYCNAARWTLYGSQQHLVVKHIGNSGYSRWLIIRVIPNTLKSEPYIFVTCKSVILGKTELVGYIIF